MQEINDEGEGIALYTPMKRGDEIVPDVVILFINIGVDEEELADIIIN